jgi:hypothetical protein
MYYNSNRAAYLPIPFFPSEFLVAEFCLADPGLVRYAQGLFGPMLFHAGNMNNSGMAFGANGLYSANAAVNDYPARILAARDRHAAARLGVPDALEKDALPPHWNNATLRSVWFAQEGYVTHAWSDAASYLLFDTPLAGTFEFSVDTYTGFSASGHAGYGGVVFEPNMGTGTVWPVGRSEMITRRAEGVRPEEFNRLTLQVSPGKVRCLVNGTLFYEDTDPPPISPWVMLVSGTPGRRAVYRNFSLTGKPEVPAEVKLTSGDYLDGWVVQPYPGVVPQRLTPKEPDKDEQQQQGRRFFNQQEEADKKDPVYDWQSKGGEILGRKLDRATERAVPDRLAYFRPLRPGETLKYEFFYEPGKTTVHPSLGKLAFLLEPDGVKLHWLADRVVDDWTGLAADNAVAAPGGAKGPLPLKAGDWNTVTVQTTKDALKVDLNGTTVYQAKLSADADRQFGLFHYRDRTSVRVRNVVLTGTWPKTVPAAEDSGFATKNPPPPVARARRRQLGERQQLL